MQSFTDRPDYRAQLDCYGFGVFCICMLVVKLIDLLVARIHLNSINAFFRKNVGDPKKKQKKSNFFLHDFPEF